MAKDVRVKISGEETLSNAAKSASGGLDGLLKSALGLVGANAALDIIQKIGDGLKKVKEFADECVQAWADEEKALLSLNAAANVSPFFSGQGAGALEDYALQMSKVTGETKDSIMAMETYLVVSGRNEEEIKKIIQVASNLSVATGTDLRTNIERLNGTYDGTLSRMDKLFPELKDLTKTQLENGDAIDVIAGKVKGLSDALANSTDVSIKNYKNAWTELKAQVGEGVSTIFTPLRDALTTMVQNWADNTKEVNNYRTALKNLDSDNAITAARAKLTVLQHQLLSVMESQQGALQMAGLQDYRSYLANSSQTDSPKAYAEYMQSWNSVTKTFTDKMDVIAKQIDQTSKDLAKLQADAAKGAGGGTSGTGTGGKDSNALTKLSINDYLQEMALKGAELAKDQVKVLMIEWAEADERAKKDFTGKDLVTALDADKNYFVNAIADVYAKQAQVDADNAKKLVDAQIAEQKKEAEDALALAKQSEENRKKQAEQELAFQQLNNEILNRVASNTAADASRWQQQDLSGQNGLLGATFGQLANTQVGQAAGIDYSGAAGGMVSFIASIASAVMSIKSIQMILNPLSTIFQAMMTVLQPLIDSILAPIVGILVIIGETLGKVLAPILQTILVPVVTFLGKAFVWLYNEVILPLGNIIIGFANVIQNIGIAIHNFIDWALNGSKDQVSYRDLSTGALQRITLTDLSNAGTNAINNSSSGSSASYSQQRPITNYFTINTDVMVGNGGFDDFVKLVSKRSNELGLTGNL
jgi:hypothetical protein